MSLRSTIVGSVIAGSGILALFALGFPLHAIALVVGVSAALIAFQIWIYRKFSDDED